MSVKREKNGKEKGAGSQEEEEAKEEPGSLLNDEETEGLEREQSLQNRTSQVSVGDMSVLLAAYSLPSTTSHHLLG